MNRKEFMERLERMLWNISDSEREEALQYYNDYFDDAGEENEEKVIEELGSPSQVAQKIKAGCSDQTSEYSEQGYEDTRFRASQEVISKEEAERERADSSSSIPSAFNAEPNRQGKHFRCPISRLSVASERSSPSIYSSKAASSPRAASSQKGAVPWADQSRMAGERAA